MSAMSVDTPGPSVETMSHPTFINPIDAIAVCQVCLEPFSEVEHIPKLLPCGHTFCENCIISLAKTYIYTCKCPKCRAVFMLRYDTVFPTNYSLMDVLSQLRQSVLEAKEGKDKVAGEKGLISDVEPSNTPSDSQGAWNTSKMSQFLSKFSERLKRNKDDTRARETQNETYREMPLTSAPNLSADEEVFGYGASPYMDSDDENDNSGIEEQLSPYESIDVAPMSNEQGPASVERSAPGIDERRAVNVPVESSGGAYGISESGGNVHMYNDGPAVESDLPQTESRGGHASTMSTVVCVNSGATTEDSPKGSIIRWSLVVLLQLAMLLIIFFWMATFMNLIDVRYRHQNDEPSIFCTSLEVIDSWLSTKFVPSVNCQRTKSQSLLERLNIEAEQLSSDVYHIVSYIVSSSVDCVSGTGSELTAYVTSFVNMAREKSYMLMHFMSGLISDMYSAVLMLQKALHDALLSRRSNDPTEEL
uniref:RING-type domain-containing protein n=1 Tax=Parascaris univalens TaxID=6257 RepID=A0A915C2U2_PARUN